MDQNKYASATEFAEGGGLYDDVDVEVLKAETRIHAFPGKQDQFAVLYMQVKEIESGDVHDEYLLAGSIEVFGVDGQGFIPKDPKRPSLGKSSSVATWNESCMDAGYPADRFASGTYGHFVGQRFHILRRPITDRKTGAIKKNTKGYDMTNLAVSKWLSSSGGGSTASGGDDSAIVNWIITKLAANPAGVAQNILFAQIIAEQPAGVDVMSIGNKFIGDSWLKANFDVTGGIVTLKSEIPF
jgi:hypothetical protein